MNLNIYSIFDSAAQAFTQPFFMHNDGLAIRAFQDNVNASDNNIANHPHQFSLYKLGTYDDSNGLVTPETPPKSLALAIELVNPDETTQLHNQLLTKMTQVEKLLGNLNITNLKEIIK